MRMNSLSLNHFRLRLSEVEALPQWALLGLLSGILTALVILAFRTALFFPLAHFLPGGDAENFEELPDWLRFALPICGSALVALLFIRWPKARVVGVTHVLERLSYHQGRMPWANLLSQFVAGVIMLGSGHSGGREGPAVHMGASISSLLGQQLRLPNNSLRTLVGCGTAAAIAASFNTPIAGIIFAMEVVMMEYTVAGFIPVLVAAVSASLLFQLALGDQIHFPIPPIDIYTLNEVPFILLLGLAVGLLAVLFSRITGIAGRAASLPIAVRLLIAGVVTGTVALQIPQVMGIGYDTLNDILYQGGTLNFLLLLVGAKLVVTAIAIGLGAPIGLIGPTLLIGAAAGSAIGMVGIDLAEQQVSELTLYALLGMGAMMAATLQAPLAALLALLELTLNPNILFPGMLAIITATITYRFCCPSGSVFQIMLTQRGLDWRRAPLDHYLDSASVVSLLRRHSAAASRSMDREAATLLTRNNSDWILIEAGPERRIALARADLASYLEQHPDDDQIDLLEMPALRHDLATTSMQATLRDALTEMNNKNVDALCVMSLKNQPLGLVLRAEVERRFQSSGQPTL